MSLKQCIRATFVAAALIAGNAVAQAPATKPAPAPATAVAPGGGPGMVWVNTKSKVYHCPGTTYYGKTKAGKYLSEDAAKAEGDKPNAGKTCAK